MKKKYTASSKDKKDWVNFTNQIGNIRAKSVDLLKQKTGTKNFRKLDLHGFSLDEANKVTKKFINESFDLGYRKLLIVTGKGSRSKSFENPYISEKLSILKHSVPEFIKQERNISSKIYKVTEADIEDGGEGAIYIFLKKNL